VDVKPVVLLVPPKEACYVPTTAAIHRPLRQKMPDADVVLMVDALDLSFVLPAKHDIWS
jgi:hypothetical protein